MMAERVFTCGSDRNACPSAVADRRPGHVTVVNLVRIVLAVVGIALAMRLDAAGTGEPARTVFQNVHVLTMAEQGALRDATVVVEGGRITRISSGPGASPVEGRIIDGRGRTLMPGLADMHVHYWSESAGPLFLSNSITTVRNPWGTAQSLILDAGAKRGVLVGPHIYSSGPLMDGPEPIWGEGSIKLTSPEQAVGAVESQRTTGYRAVKLYEGLTPEIYRAAVQAAKDRDMQVWTHVPMSMRVEDVISLRVDSIEHLDNVGDSVFAGDGDADYFEAWANADPERMQELAARSAEAAVWHSPTLSVIAKRYEYGADAEAFFRREEAAYVGPGLSEWWRGSAARMGEYDDERRAAAANQKAFVKLLYDTGAPLLIGTDTPNPFVLPGFAIHDEMAMFVEAGIPVLEVLRIATAEAARFLREEGEWGVVAVDARADLVLLDADPRDDPSTLARPLGVMVNGHWHDADSLSRELAALRESNRAAATAAD